MAIHGLTRVTFDGDRVIVVAGPVPPEIAVQGLVQEVKTEPVITPMTPVKHVVKQETKPARRFEAKPPTVEKENSDGK